MQNHLPARIRNICKTLMEVAADYRKGGNESEATRLENAADRLLFNIDDYAEQCVATGQHPSKLLPKSLAKKFVNF